DRRIGPEARSPEPIADDRLELLDEHRRGRKAGADFRRDAENGEKVARDLDGFHANRIAVRLGEVDDRLPPRGAVLEHLRKAAIVHEVDRRNRLVLNRALTVGFTTSRAD